MKLSVFFNGDYMGPGGPRQVNKNIVQCLNNELAIKKPCSSPYLGYVDNFLKILRNKSVVFSGLLYRPYEAKLAKKLGKKIIYIMHGCALIESGRHVDTEDFILENSDLILCVSETFKRQMQNYFPQYADKMQTLTNGVNWEELETMKRTMPHNIKRDQNRVILFGGGRTTKMNISVCRAIQEINQENGYNLYVDVYGYYKDNDDSQKIAEVPCVTFHSVIPHDLINLELAKSRLFIQNSSFEPFSLALMDSLIAGCDVLFSRYVGAQDLISGKTEYDIINDPEDIAEIKRKILHLLENPNNARLLDSVDRDDSSLQSATNRFLEYCEQYG